MDRCRDEECTSHLSLVSSRGMTAFVPTFLQLVRRNLQISRISIVQWSVLGAGKAQPRGGGEGKGWNVRKC